MMDVSPRDDSTLVQTPSVLEALHRDFERLPSRSALLEVRAALRELERKLLTLQSDPPTLRVVNEGSSFQLSGQPAVDMRRKPVLRRVLKKLVDTRLAEPGRGVPWTELFSAGWPDDRATPEASFNRVRNAVWTVRHLGLGEWLRRTDDGYCIDPAVMIEQTTTTA